MSLALAPLDPRVELGYDRSGSARLAPRSDPDQSTNVPCRKFDPDLWFAESPTELELAKSLCGDCPVRVECLAGAVERAEPWGVWGGEIFQAGVVVPRKRPRGRPRKGDAARDAALQVEMEARVATTVSAAHLRLAA